MVNRCVNPGCKKEFKRFTAGELYALYRRSADTEFFWLCPVCAVHLVVCVDSAGCVGVLARTECRSLQRPDPEHYLRHVFPDSIGPRRDEAGRSRRMTLSAEAGREPCRWHREVA
jgi:hypothetical protein